MNALPKVVLSDSLGDVGWTATVEFGPIAEAVERIKYSHNGEIVAVGGISTKRDRLHAVYWVRLSGSSLLDRPTTTTSCCRPSVRRHTHRRSRS
jgi:hypothetical protein